MGTGTGAMGGTGSTGTSTPNQTNSFTGGAQRGQGALFTGLGRILGRMPGNSDPFGFSTMPSRQPPESSFAPSSYQMPNAGQMPGEVPLIVNQAYNRILNRPADAAGAASWQDQMANQNLTGQQLLSGFTGSPEFQRRQQFQQAYTQQFRPGPTGRPFNSNPTPAPATGPQGQTLTTVNGQQGYYRPATSDEIRRSSGDPVYAPNWGRTPVEGYDARSRQVFVPYSAPRQTAQSQQFFQPIYLGEYQNYAPQGFQGPFGGSSNPYGGFNPFMGFGGYGGMYGRDMYGYAEGGDVDEYESDGGIDELLK
jgi:hypothetical protein